MYNYTKKVSLEFNDAVEKVKKLLLEQEFGILSEINVKDTLKKKINVDFSNYIILGVCNPSSAHKILLSEKEIGLFLPCNVVVYTMNNKTFVSSVLPTKLMERVNHPEIKEIANYIEDKLKLAVSGV